MNYRHAFHAGGFADVVKHAVMMRILVHLRAKPAAFRVIDTHAGAGRYDLTGPEAARGGEWRAGIARLHAAALDARAALLLAPYRDIVAAANPGERLSVYPGSPLIALSLMRPQDRLLACEFEPGAAGALAANLRGDRRARVVAIDGWTALSAYVPPRERRGLVLVDPAYEQADEFSRLAAGLAAAHRKWPTGIYLAWYPIKERAATEAFGRRLARLGIAKMLRGELSLAVPESAGPLSACGVIVVNPPWTLPDELEVLLASLSRLLSPTGDGACRVDWLRGEK
jgi:23S rRNA (adenine2030-N6)-methyltransferase